MSSKQVRHSTALCFRKYCLSWKFPHCRGWVSWAEPGSCLCHLLALGASRGCSQLSRCCQCWTFRRAEGATGLPLAASSARSSTAQRGRRVDAEMLTAWWGAPVSASKPLQDPQAGLEHGLPSSAGDREIFPFSEGRTRSRSSLNLLAGIYLMLNTGQTHVACGSPPQEAAPAGCKCCETLMGTSQGSRVERSTPNTAAGLEPGRRLLPRDRPWCWFGCCHFAGWKRVR